MAQLVRVHSLNWLRKCNQLINSKYPHNVISNARAFHLNATLNKAVTFNLSDIGEGIHEVSVKEWFVKEGQEVSEFDNICEVQSDKASVTITSRYDGKILKLHHKIDDIALVGKPLLDFDVVEEGDEEDSSSSSSDSSSSSSDSDNETNEPEKLSSNKVLTTPSVRRLAKENNVDLTKVPPTGKLGRILKGDMLEYLNLIPKGTQKLHPTLVAKQVEKSELETPPALTKRTVISPLEGKTVVLKGVPKIMFKSMTASLKIPHFSYSDEVDMTKLVSVREEVKKEALLRGVKLTYMPFFIKAASVALHKYPILNSTVDEKNESITYKPYHNISVALHTSLGLVVPNIKNVHLKSILDIAKELNQLQERGLNNALTPDDFANGTFSLSNIGIRALKKKQQQPAPQRQQTIYESTYDANKLRDLINKARFARCRARFPLPVIFYRGKYICRSATLSGGPEIYSRTGFDYLFCGDNTNPKPNLEEPEAYEAQESSLNEEVFVVEEKGREWQLFDRVRNQDIKLLKTLNVGTIADFMVEKKKVKFLMNVTSSEKVDKEKRYADFRIISLPYPGCEFFREFRDNNYSGEGLIFDWSQKNVDAAICVPDDPVTAQMNINWETYKGWDLVQITQNYLKLLLKYLQDNSSGLLIHCISGWDRTPLFVSLLRLSLWADGAIHQTLSAMQILYFTIAYDWMLFGHNLPDRLSKGEDIFFFCFYALKYLMDDEFSIVGQRFRSKHSSSGSSSIGVIRTDSDVFDGILFDGDSRGSSVSLNSTCSCISTRSHQEQNVNVASANGVHTTDENNANGNSWIHNQDSSNSIGVLSNESGSNLLNWSPQLHKRTSPMSIQPPNNSSASGNLHRQRLESTSSISVGSWQMISGTGSLRSQDSNIIVINEQTSTNQCNNNNFNNIFNNQQPPHVNYHHAASGGSSMAANGPSTDSTCTIVDDDCFTANDYFLRRERLTAVRTLFYNCYSSTVGYKFKTGPDSALGSLLGNFAEKVGLSSQRTGL